MVAPAWGVTAQLYQNDEHIKLAIGQIPEAPGRRIIKIDGRTTSSYELSTYVTMFWLTPEQDRLFRGPAGDRRKFLDRFTLMHAPSHGREVVAYEKLRAERNRLLSEGQNDTSWYEALEADMARHGANIARARSETVTQLIEAVEARPSGPFPKSIILLEGEAEEDVQSGLSPETVETNLRIRWSENRRDDLRAGRTLSGIHKSDLRVTHAEKNMPAENCSTGEQKALLIGLMLAQARAHSDKDPYLLLDEVAAHLDEHRRAALVEELIDLKLQTFMTGTDASLFSAFAGQSEMFEVRDGTINSGSQS